MDGTVAYALLKAKIDQLSGPEIRQAVGKALGREGM